MAGHVLRGLDGRKVTTLGYDVELRAGDGAVDLRRCSGRGHTVFSAHDDLGRDLDRRKDQPLVFPLRHRQVLPGIGRRANPHHHLDQIIANVLRRVRMDQADEAGLGERPHLQARQRRGVGLVKSRRPCFADGTRAMRAGVYKRKAADPFGRKAHDLQRHHAPHGDAGQAKGPRRIGQDPSGHAHQRVVLEGVADPRGNPIQSGDGSGLDGRVAALVRDQHEVLHSGLCGRPDRKRQ
jgi:hypothetical protein